MCAYQEEIERFGSVSTELELLQILKTFLTGQLFMGCNYLLKWKAMRVRILVRKGILE